MATTPPPPPPTPGFCTVVPLRTPETKVHTRIGHAKSAVGQSYYSIVHDRQTHGHYCSGVRGGQLFEWKDGGWSLLFDIAPRTPECEVPWRKAT